MPPFDDIIVRGIFIDAPLAALRYRLFIKAYPDNVVITIEIPNTTILNRGQIRQAIRNYYGIVNLKVTFPDFLKHQFPS